MSTPLTVGSVTAAPGQLASGWIEVPDGVDPGTRIPVTVANGAAPGPVLALVGRHARLGVHVDPRPPAAPARLEPPRMRGAAILVHMANPPAFYGRRIYYGPDGKNLNRVYPGKADGTVSDRIAHAITREVIDRCTHLADMHCGDGNESLRPYTYWIVGGDAGRRRGVAGARARLRARPHPRRPRAARGPGREPLHGQHGDHSGASRRSRPSREASAPRTSRRSRPTRPARARCSPTSASWTGRRRAVDAPGLDRPRGGPPRPGDRRLASRRREDAVGLDGPACSAALTDPFGTVLHEVRAPFAGEVVYVVATPPVTAGEPLLRDRPPRGDARGRVR